MWSIIIFSNQYPLVNLFIWQHPLLAHTNPLTQFWNPNSPTELHLCCQKTLGFIPSWIPIFLFLVFMTTRKIKISGPSKWKWWIEKQAAEFQLYHGYVQSGYGLVDVKTKMQRTLLSDPKLEIHETYLSQFTCCPLISLNLGRTINGPVDRLSVYTHSFNSMKSQWVCVYTYKRVIIL